MTAKRKPPTEAETLSREVEALAALKETLQEALNGDPDFLLDVIEGETNLLEVLDMMALADLHDDVLVAGIKDAQATLKERRDRIEARKAIRRALMERTILMLDRKKLERPTATFTLADIKPKPVIEDESQIPSRFWVEQPPPPPKLDKDALEAALAGGEEVSGARLDNGSVRLTIRRK